MKLAIISTVRKSMISLWSLSCSLVKIATAAQYNGVCFYAARAAGRDTPHTTDAGVVSNELATTCFRYCERLQTSSCITLILGRIQQQNSPPTCPRSMTCFSGNWVGRSILKRLQDSDHRLIIDFLTVLMIINFIYLATY